MADLGLEPILSRLTIQDSVHQQLRHALMTGRFDPGQVMTIASLADSFGTSHMPVREALRRLAAENALEIAPNGSARVPFVTRARLDDLCRARIAVEGLATELGAGQITGRDIASLETMVAEQERIAREDSVYDMLGKNRLFHFTIYRASGSEVLIQLIESLWLQAGPYMRRLSAHVEPLLRAGTLAPYTGHHHAIIAALKAGDAARAREEMIGDIRTTQDLLRTLCPTEAEAPTKTMAGPV
jgi:DNA-binding GntR family transcriptional regulator